jgi:hypothetical protein
MDESGTVVRELFPQPRRIPNCHSGDFRSRTVTHRSLRWFAFERPCALCEIFVEETLLRLFTDTVEILHWNSLREHHLI